MSDRPNVLLIIADQHRFDWLEGTPGLPVRTPTLAALAARGMAFTHATTPAPLCAPARACLATATDYRLGPVPNNFVDMPPDADTYYRRLRESGYFVAGVGKFDLHKATFDWNLDGSRLMNEWGLSEGIDNEGKFDSLWSGATEPHGPYMKHLYDRDLAAAHIEDFRRRAKAPYADTTFSPLPATDYLDNWVADNARAVLARRPEGAPWHMQINFAGPHDPMDVTAEMAERWQHVEFPDPVDAQPFAGDHQEVRRRYAAMIENIDTRVGEILDMLDAEGELDDTYVIYASDHGEMLGDHGIWGKQVALGPSIRIPLVVAGPGIEPGQRSDALVSFEDIAATILDLAGVEPGGQMTARSFLPLLRGVRADIRTHVVSGLDRSAREIEAASRHYGSNPWVRLRAWRSVSTKQHKLVVSEDLEHPVLLAIGTDPGDLTDHSADHPEEVARLLALLGEWTPHDTSAKGPTIG